MEMEPAGAVTSRTLKFTLCGFSVTGQVAFKKKQPLINIMKEKKEAGEGTIRKEQGMW